MLDSPGTIAAARPAPPRRRRAVRAAQVDAREPRADLLAADDTVRRGDFSAECGGVALEPRVVEEEELFSGPVHPFRSHRRLRRWRVRSGLSGGDFQSF